MDKRKINLELLIKIGAFGTAFVVIMLILAKTPLPSTIKEITGKIGEEIYEPPISTEWLTLFLYRIGIYFIVPLFVTAVELIFFRKKRKPKTILINLEAQFISFTIISGLFYLFALDYIFKSDIFSIKDSIISLLLFLFAILFDKDLPHIFTIKEEESKS